MIWKRSEEGAEVTVFLERIETIPMTQQDYLVGVWKLIQTKTPKEGGLIMTDLDSKIIYNFRWDREYRLWHDDKRARGYWHVNAHRPILTLLRKGESYRFEIKSVDEERLELISLEEETKGMVDIYIRQNEFPK